MLVRLFCTLGEAILGCGSDPITLIFYKLCDVNRGWAIEPLPPPRWILLPTVGLQNHTCVIHRYFKLVVTEATASFAVSLNTRGQKLLIPMIHRSLNYDSMYVKCVTRVTHLLFTSRTTNKDKRPYLNVIKSLLVYNTTFWKGNACMFTRCLKQVAGAVHSKHSSGGESSAVKETSLF